MGFFFLFLEAATKVREIYRLYYEKKEEARKGSEVLDDPIIVGNESGIEAEVKT